MIAYNRTSLLNLRVVKDTKSWADAGFINARQMTAINEAYPVNFYHPNFIIRILLFIATVIALAGVTGLFGLIFLDAFEDAIEVLCILYGIGCWIFLDLNFVRRARHYKSGVNEALLYHSAGWIFGGLAALSDFNEHFMLITGMIISAFAAMRYADLIATATATALFTYLIFFEMYSIGGAAQFYIPPVLLTVFTPLYLLIRKLKTAKSLQLWRDCLLVAESIALVIIYASGNYLVVRELTILMMGLDPQPGEDIPLAWLFYGLTVVIPLLYLYAGIKLRDVVLLRISLLAVAFSVFTFKYYFSLGHPEITLTLAGAVLIAVSLGLFRYLVTQRSGFTREKLLKQKWAEANPEAFLISQTLGGNASVPEGVEAGGGGTSGGGGSSEGW